MDSTVDKLEQMFQNAELTLDLMFRRMKWEMQQQDDNGSFPVEPLLVLEELELMRGRVCALVSEVCAVREQKRQVEDAIRAKQLRIAQLAMHTNTTAALSTVAALLAAAQDHPQGAPDDSACRPECGTGAAQNQPKNGRPARGGVQSILPERPLGVKAKRAS
ncbi:hypothetical protein ACEWY4_009030 [Coilia grayii]|uniref:Ska2 N-terminal domain-containing protein n=1 Tax=Coilia grayii TaxID=363190 RepID=A0ABD1K5A2_9TELE